MRAPAICTPVRRRLLSVMAEFFQAIWRALRALPGIGDYTSAAVGSIAFDLPAVPVDGNVERVVSRVFACAGGVAGGQAGHQATGDKSIAAAALRRFRASLHGSRRHDLLAEKAGLRAVSLDRRLRDARARRPGNVPAQGAQARRQATARRGLCRAARRRPRAAAPAPGEGPARFDDRSAGQRLGA